MSYTWENELANLANFSDQEVANIINDMKKPIRQLVPLWKIKNAGLQSGWWLVAKASIATNVASATLFEYYQDPRFENIDMDLDATKYVVANLVSTNIMTQEQADAVDDLANALGPKYSEFVHAQHVAEVRN